MCIRVLVSEISLTECHCAEMGRTWGRGAGVPAFGRVFRSLKWKAATGCPTGRSPLKAFPGRTGRRGWSVAAVVGWSSWARTQRSLTALNCAVLPLDWAVVVVTASAFRSMGGLPCRRTTVRPVFSTPPPTSAAAAPRGSTPTSASLAAGPQNVIGLAGTRNRAGGACCPGTSKGAGLRLER